PRAGSTRLRLGPVDVPCRGCAFQRLPAIEATLAPFTVDISPIARRRAAVFDVFQILRVAPRPRCDGERRDLHVVRPLLVVEDEALLAALRADADASAGAPADF